MREGVLVNLFPGGLLWLPDRVAPMSDGLVARRIEENLLDERNGAACLRIVKSDNYAGVALL